jgi:hypothetical protein
LDNYNDIVLDLGAYNLNSTYYVWLYDKTKRLFSDYIVFQNNDGLIPDSIFTTTFQELGGRGGYSNIYKIIDGDFILIETRISSNDGYSGSYQNTFYENGKMKVTVDGIYLWDNSENSNDTVVVRFYEDIFDSLLVEKTIWLLYHYDDSYKVRTDLYDKILDNNFYNYIKKEEYNYLKKDGNILVDTTKYKYYKNNWIPIQ